MQMALEYMRLNNLSHAQERIERALGEAPDNPNVQETAGLVYERLNDLPKAKHAFSAAARLGKNDPDIQNSYAGFLCRTGKAAEGEKLFLEVAQNPVYQTPEVALLNAGVCVGSAGDVVDAERYFNRALTIRPNMPEALLELGNLAFSRGDYKQALDYVLRYLAVNPASPPKCCGSDSGRSASSATTRPPPSTAGASRPSFPIPSRRRCCAPALINERGRASARPAS